MIKSITMKNCATYPAEGASIENCQKVNFFYGPNGSGKSTISRFLQDPNSEQYSDCVLEWEQNEALDILVYNREFRERNFKEDMAGVFTLGQATIEEIQALEDLKEENRQQKEDLHKREASLKTKCDEEKKHQEDFRDTVWNAILKENETDFQEAFSGFRGNKEKFRDEVLRRYTTAHTSDRSRSELLDRAKSLFGNKPQKYDEIEFSINALCEQLSLIEKNAIWCKVVVGNSDIPIAQFIQSLDNADWVNHGRKYITNDICPFCQQATITAGLKDQLNSFFSGEYEKDVQCIHSQIDQYRKTSENVLSHIKDTVNVLSVCPVSGIDADKILSLVKILEAHFSGNLSEMSIKEKEPGRKIILTLSISTIEEICKIIVAGNSAIIKHNQMVEHLNDEKKALIDDIWTFLMDEQEALISGYLNDISDFSKAKKGIQSGIDESKRKLKILDDQIFEAGKNITSVQPTVDEINRSLKAYGFTNFMIVPSPVKENAYQIQRLDGTIAKNTLSEGEETFISFLYFLQFSKGSTDSAKVSSKKVLVLDDPICSLDSTVLYIVSSMVRTLIRDIRSSKSDVAQIFILTHNVFFHKEASFIDGRMEICNDINYWTINKDRNLSVIMPHGRENPIKTSYELLWQELRENTSASLITTQNIMRRILENYFGILGKRKDDKIIESFETAEEQIICRALLSWVNDGSHSIPDDFFIDSYTDSVDRYKQVFKGVFLSMGHEAHYNMMMGLPY